MTSTTIWPEVKPYPRQPLLAPTLVLEPRDPLGLANSILAGAAAANVAAAKAVQAGGIVLDTKTAPTQHERIAAKLEELYAEVDGLIDSLPPEYLEAGFATAEALDTARVAWARGPRGDAA